MVLLLLWVHQVSKDSSSEDLEEGHEAIQEQELYQDKAQQQDSLSATNKKDEFVEQSPEVNFRNLPGIDLSC